MAPSAELSLSTAASSVRQSVFATLQDRIEAYRAAGGELVPLHIGDTYLAPPPAVFDVGGVEQGDLSRYGPVPGLAELREELSSWRRQCGLVASEGPQNVHVGCGCTHALFCAVRAVLDPGDDVLAVSPYWPLIPGVVRTAGARPIDVPISGRLYSEPDYDIAAALEAAMTPKTRALYFVTPNNPDGQVYTLSQLEQLAGFARKHNLWVLADEVYADFVYEGEHRSIACLPGMAERTITSHSMSKSHALAGARIGYVVAPERVIDATRRISNHTVYNVPLAMQRAALAALSGHDHWIGQARADYRRARDDVSAALSEIGVVHDRPRGGSFFFVDLSTALRGRPMRVLLERGVEQGVLFAPGSACGTDFAAHARLCFTGVPAAQIVEGVRRLGRALELLG